MNGIKRLISANITDFQQPLVSRLFLRYFSKRKKPLKRILMTRRTGFTRCAHRTLTREQKRSGANQFID
jgi:hypothetical protein